LEEEEEQKKEKNKKEKGTSQKLNLELSSPQNRMATLINCTGLYPTTLHTILSSPWLQNLMEWLSPHDEFCYCQCLYSKNGPQDGNKWKIVFK